MRLRSWHPWSTMSLVVPLVMFGFFGCSGSDFDYENPSRGPGQFVGNGERVSQADFVGGADTLPDPLQVTPPIDGSAPDCGSGCIAYCETANLQNPVNRGMCRSLWGVGLSHQPVVRAEACRRVFVDMLGRFPTKDESVAQCDGKTYGEVVQGLMSTDEFIEVNQRRWADKLSYDTQSVNVERVFDMDNLVAKLYRGTIAYDEFASVLSAHPVLTRRYMTPTDRADVLFWLLMGRPPLDAERADLARLYRIWYNGYYDHPDLGMRVPDAHVGFPCVNNEGYVDEATRGDCASVLWGYNEVIIEPDLRARENEQGNLSMWSGIIKADEWELLQTPGRILSTHPTTARTFWETVVDDVLMQYLGYDLGTLIPSVREELVNYVLRYNGDIRSLHFAVATSAAYLQSATGVTQTDYRWTFGPSKQVEAEVWVDSMMEMADYDLSACDRRITRPEDFLESGSVAGYVLVEKSDWSWNDEGIDYSYRNVVRPLGGCPDNSVGGRFKIISILTTAQQLNFVNRVCAPGGGGGADISTLLPAGMDPQTPLDEAVASQIYEHQTGTFLARTPTAEESGDIAEYVAGCQNCSAADFARPTCFAMLSSAEMLFY